MIVLGIETSCDETGIALYSGDRGLIAHRLHSQVATHAAYGGVVPELASRDHVRRVLPLVQDCLAEEGLDAGDIGGIAYARGPGLAGALLVGASVAEGLGWALDCPVLGVHHMEAHLLAPMLEPDPPAFPFLALLVSGGSGCSYYAAPVAPMALLSGRSIVPYGRAGGPLGRGRRGFGGRRRLRRHAAAGVF